PPKGDTQSTKPRQTEFHTATSRSRTNLRTIKNLRAGSRAPLANGSLARPPEAAEQPPTNEQAKERFPALMATLRTRSKGQDGWVKERRNHLAEVLGRANANAAATETQKRSAGTPTEPGGNEAKEARD